MEIALRRRLHAKNPIAKLSDIQVNGQNTFLAPDGFHTQR
ncbi:hypothetical protein SDC9_212507 [bioreactor metagenome]|uniref:Uncharacterized protein n=1 Tax=bioreactor metagenome TaxID=1076179 RepID=A0A645JNR6_9ZZZZ